MHAIWKLFALLFLVLAAACATKGAERTDHEPRGTLNLPLEVTTADGSQYRLTSSHFTITGADGSQNLDGDGLPLISLSLAGGSYDILLGAGWQLERRESGSDLFEAVEATLVSQNPYSFVIGDQSTTRVTFRFDVAGREIDLGHGTLEVAIAVHELGAACNGKAACISGEFTIAVDWQTVNGLSTTQIFSGVVDEPVKFALGFDITGVVQDGSFDPTTSYDTGPVALSFNHPALEVMAKNLSGTLQSLDLTDQGPLGQKLSFNVACADCAPGARGWGMEMHLQVHAELVDGFPVLKDETGVSSLVWLRRYSPFTDLATGTGTASIDVP